jgi:hypothetical protein
MKIEKETFASYQDEWMLDIYGIRTPLRLTLMTGIWIALVIVAYYSGQGDAQRMIELSAYYSNEGTFTGQQDSAGNLYGTWMKCYPYNDGGIKWNCIRQNTSFADPWKGFEGKIPNITKKVG